MYTTVEASQNIDIKPDAFRKRANSMGLMPDIVGKVFMWNDKQVDLVKRYNRTRSTNFFKYHKMNISIVDFYLTHRYNTQIEIANSMGISVSKVNRALTEFLDTGCITVASKINVDNFNK